MVMKSRSQSDDAVMMSKAKKLHVKNQVTKDCKTLVNTQLLISQEMT